jgi:hypothetical protein
MVAHRSARKSAPVQSVRAFALAANDSSPPGGVAGFRTRPLTLSALCCLRQSEAMPQRCFPSADIHDPRSISVGTTTAMRP